MPLALSVRRTSVQPAAVMVTVLGPTVIDAIITSFCATPAGLLIVSVFDPPPPPTPRSARIWVVPGPVHTLHTLAVFAPVAPAVACTTVLPSVETVLMGRS